MKDTADVVVVGLGAVGSAVAHYLASGGAKVIGIDRFRPPHTHGSSHGATRITRLAIGEGDEFVPLVARSHILWRELEAATGETLMTTTGGLVIASAGSDLRPFHGQLGFFDRTLQAAERFGIVHERLDAVEIRQRFPAFMPADDERGYWERDAGVLYPERCVAAHLAAAARDDADLRYATPMRDLEADPDSHRVTVVTDKGSITCGQVVIAMGAWLPGLLEPRDCARFAVQRQVLHWFEPSRPDVYAPGRCPVFIWMHGTSGDSFYGFPMADPYPGVKVATEQTSQHTTADEIERHVSEDETRHTFDHHVLGRLCALTRRSVHNATCLYTSTSDGRFVIDRHPGRPQVTMVSACSGHGFKHSAAVGEAVADGLLGKRPRVDISSFATLID